MSRHLFSKTSLLVFVFSCFSFSTHFFSDELSLTRSGATPPTLSSSTTSNSITQDWVYTYATGAFTWELSGDVAHTWDATETSWHDHKTGSLWNKSGGTWSPAYGSVKTYDLSTSHSASEYVWREDWQLENNTAGTVTFQAKGAEFHIGLQTDSSSTATDFEYEIVVGGINNTSCLVFKDSDTTTPVVSQLVDGNGSEAGTNTLPDTATFYDFWLTVEVNQTNTGQVKTRIGTGTTPGIHDAFGTGGTDSYMFEYIDTTTRDMAANPLRLFSFSGPENIVKSFKNIESVAVTNNASPAANTWSYQTQTATWKHASTPTPHYWAYNATANTWTNQTDATVWTFDTRTNTWTSVTDPSVTWTLSSSVLQRMTLGSTGDEWEQTAPLTWLNKTTEETWTFTGSNAELTAKPTFFPPLFAVHQETIRSAAGAIDGYGWNLAAQSATVWSGASSNGDDTLTYDETEANNKLTLKNSNNSLFWDYNPTAKTFATSQAVLFTQPGHYASSWNGTTWSGGLSADTWSYANNVWTNQTNSATWSFAPSTGIWSESVTGNAWTYNNTNGQWTNTTPATDEVWSYSFLDNAWKEISASGNPAQNMPPLPVIYQTQIHDAFDLLRNAESFSSSGSFGWSPTLSEGVWSATNTGSDETITYTPATPEITWKNNKNSFIDNKVNWTYNPTTGAWTWTHSLDENTPTQTWTMNGTTWTDSTATWTYNAKVWTNTSDASTWTYQADGEKWISSASGAAWTYDKSADEWSNTSVAATWKYDATAQKWVQQSGDSVSDASNPALPLVQHMHIRNVMQSLQAKGAFTPSNTSVSFDATSITETDSDAPATTTWNYVVDSDEWTWSHTQDALWTESWSVSSDTWTDGVTNESWTWSNNTWTKGANTWTWSPAAQTWTDENSKVWTYNHANGQWTNTTDSNTWTFDDVAGAWTEVTSTGATPAMPARVVWQQARITAAFDTLRDGTSFSSSGSFGWSPTLSEGVWTATNTGSDETITYTPATPEVTWKNNKNSFIDNKVNWTYNPTTGAWTWTHSLDENSPSIVSAMDGSTWSGGGQTWTYSNKSWTDGSKTWSFVKGENLSWNDGTNTWNYDSETDVWENATLVTAWKYDSTALKWIYQSGNLHSDTLNPPKSLVEHMVIRNVFVSLLRKGAFTPSNTSVTFDATSITETDSDAPATTTWNYVVDSDEWTWSHTQDALWTESWSVSEDTWTDGVTNESWTWSNNTWSKGANSWTWSPAAQTWTDENSKVWTYNHANGQWTNTTDSNTWTFDDVAGVWTEVTSTNATPVMPARVVWQQARITAAFDVLRNNENFSSSGSFGWSPTLSEGVWTATNTGSDETITYTPATPEITWKNNKNTFIDNKVNWTYNPATGTWTWTHSLDENSPSIVSTMDGSTWTGGGQTWTYSNKSWTDGSKTWSFVKGETLSWNDGTNTWKYDPETDVWENATLVTAWKYDSTALKWIYQSGNLHSDTLNPPKSLVEHMVIRNVFVSLLRKGAFTPANTSVSFDATSITETDSDAPATTTWSYVVDDNTFTWSHTHDALWTESWTSDAATWTDGVTNESWDVTQNTTLLRLEKGSDAWFFDFAAQQWIGSISGQGVTWSYDPATKQWSDLTSPPTVVWSYDHVADVWTRISESGVSTHKPPRAAVHYTMIFTAFDNLRTDTASFSSSGPLNWSISDENPWTGSNQGSDETITYDSTQETPVVTWKNASAGFIDNKINWTYTPSTGAWTWEHALDENSLKQTWSMNGTTWTSSTQTWTYNSKVWTNVSDSSTWTYQANGQIWINSTNSHAWNYNAATDIWSNTTTPATWNYDVTAQKWVQLSGESVSDTNNPALPLIQHMYIRNVMHALQAKGAFTPANTSVTFDATSLSETDSDAPATTTWNYVVDSDEWTWSHSHDALWTESWNVSGDTWTDAITDETWTWNTNTWSKGGNTWTWSPAAQTWTDENSKVWTYNHSNGQWTNTTDSNTWTFDDVAGVWTEVTSTGATPVMPARVVWQHARITAAFDVLRDNENFSSSHGSIGWNPQKDGSVYSSANVSGDEYISFDNTTPLTAQITWKNNKNTFIGNDKVYWTYTPSQGTWNWHHKLDKNSPEQTWSMNGSTWTGGGETWTYSNKVWTNSGDNSTWTYQAAGQTWTSSASGNVWSYDIPTNVWLDTTNNTTWTYDFTTQTWTQKTGDPVTAEHNPALPLIQHMHIRNVVTTLQTAGAFSVAQPAVTFDATSLSETDSNTPSQSTWNYVVDSDEWTWSHTHDALWTESWSVSEDTWTDAVTNESWTWSNNTWSKGENSWTWSPAAQTWTDENSTVWTYNHANGQWTNTTDSNTWTFDDVAGVWTEVTSTNATPVMPAHVVWQQARITAAFDVLRDNENFSSSGSFGWSPTLSEGVWGATNTGSDETITYTPATPAITWKNNKNTFIDNKVNWTYNPTTGAWTWTHSLDENSPSVVSSMDGSTWTGGGQTWTYSNKSWTDGSKTWSFVKGETLSWNDGTNTWNYDPETDVWENATLVTAWKYDSTALKWIYQSGNLHSDTLNPPKSLVEHMVIRNVFVSLLRKGAFTPANTGVTYDATSITETDSDAPATTTWNYVVDSDEWTWSHTQDALWTESWSVSSDTWTDAVTNETWTWSNNTWSKGANTWTWSPAAQTWTDASSNVWTYDYENGERWTHNSTSWTYDHVAGTWSKVAGIATADSMPPYVVWQQAHITAVFDMLRKNTTLSSYGATDWKPVLSDGVWSSTNEVNGESDNQNEYITYTPATHTATWKNNKNTFIANSKVYWSYNHKDGEWEWHHRLDENSPEQSWTLQHNNGDLFDWKEGTTVAWTYNNATRTWDNGSGTTWVYMPATQSWTDGTNHWVYAWQTNYWTNITPDTDEVWRYDFTAQKWIDVADASLTEENMPALPLCQFMHVRNVMHAFEREGALSPTNTAISFDASTISEDDTATPSVTAWTYTVSDDTWEWTATHDTLWKQRWSVAANRWKDDTTDEQWDVASDTTTISWTHAVDTGKKWVFSLPLQTWTNTQTNDTWTYDHATTSWSLGDATWTFNEIGTVWNEVTSTGDDVAMPPRLVWQHARIFGAFDKLRDEANFSSSGAQGWSPEFASGVWSSRNSASNEYMTFDTDSRVLTWKNSISGFIDNTVRWSYDMTTGDVVWDHTLDENSLAQQWTITASGDNFVWSDGTTTWTLDPVNKVWSKDGVTWSFQPASQRWLDSATSNEWSYNSSLDTWTNETTSQTWSYDFTAQKWSDTNITQAPPLPVMQQMHIRNLVTVLQDAGVFSLVGTTMYVNGETIQEKDTLSPHTSEWIYHVEDNTWTWTHTYDPLWVHTWIATADAWTNSLDATVWNKAYDDDSITWTQGQKQWIFNYASQTWTNVKPAGNVVWSYNKDARTWTNTTASPAILWSFDNIKGTWKELTDTNAAQTDLPPRVIWQHAKIFGEFDTLREDRMFSSSGATGWAPTATDNVWSSQNTNNDEYISYDASTPTTSSLHWKNNKTGFVAGKVSWDYAPQTGTWTWNHKLDENSQAQKWTLSAHPTDSTKRVWSDWITTWTYSCTNRTWTNDSETWTYQPTTQTWHNGQDTWSYSRATDQWTRSGDATTWHYDFTAQKWVEITSSGSLDADNPCLPLVQMMHIRNVLLSLQLAGAFSLTQTDVTFDANSITETDSVEPKTSTWTYTVESDTWEWNHTHDALWTETWTLAQNTWTDTETNEAWSVTTPTATTVVWSNAQDTSESWTFDFDAQTWTYTKPDPHVVWTYAHAHNHWSTGGGNWLYDHVARSWKQDPATNEAQPSVMPPRVVWQHTRIFGVFDALRDASQFSSSGATDWKPVLSGDAWSSTNEVNGASENQDEYITYTPSTAAITWKNSRSGFIDNKINWTYNPITGTWTWVHTLDENSPTQTWSMDGATWSGSGQTWTYSNKTWSGEGRTWSFVTGTSLAWNDGTRTWVYAPETDQWTNNATNTTWHYDFTAQTWLHKTGPTHSTTLNPPLPLVQHMLIRNVVRALEKHQAFSTSSLSGLTVQNDGGGIWSGSVTGDDELLSYDVASDPEALLWKTNGAVAHQQNTVRWNHNPDTGGWVWEHACDSLWQRTWNHTGTTWTDTLTNEEWVYTPSTKTWSRDAQSWTHQVAQDNEQVKQWSDGTKTWTFDQASQQWKNLTDNQTWFYDTVALTWVEITSTGADTTNNPPLPVVQKAIVDTAFDALRASGALSSAGSHGWNFSDQQDGTWLTANSGANETVTFSPAMTSQLVWKNKEGDITWSYNPLTGKWRWYSSLDVDDVIDGTYEEGTLSWTQNGSSNTWNYAINTRTWTNASATHSWTYTPLTNRWTHNESGNYWVYTSTNGEWVPNGDGSVWYFDTARHQFVKASGTSSIGVYPPHPLAQQEIIRGAIAALRQTDALATSGSYGWSMEKQQDGSWVGNNSSSDETITYDENAAQWHLTYANSGDKTWQQNSLSWKHNLATGDWIVSDVIDKHIPSTWSYNAETGQWTDANDQETWVFAQAGSATWSYDGEVWTYDKEANTWTSSISSHAWSYNPETGVWSNASNSTAWRYEPVSRSWKQTSGDAIAAVNMPPLALVQQEIIFVATTTLFKARAFSTSNSSQWSITDNEDATWTAVNNEGQSDDELYVFDRSATPSLVWRNNKQQSFINNKVHLVYAPRTGSWTLTHDLHPRRTDNWSFDGETDTWTDGSDEWTYNRATKTWTDGSAVWAYHVATQQWKNDTATWSYNKASDTWSNIDASTSWLYDVTAGTWVETTTTNASVANMPPLALVQHMHIRNIMHTLQKAHAFSIDSRLMTHTNTTITKENDADDVTATWTNNPEDGSWTWEETYDALWKQAWTHSGTEWKDLVTDETWTYDESAYTWTHGSTVWTYNPTTTTWSSTLDDAVWTYNYQDETWSNATNNTVWKHDTIAHVWTEQTETGAVAQNMPPLPIIQQEEIFDGFDTMLQAGTFSTDGSQSWSMTDLGDGAFSMENSNASEATTYTASPTADAQLSWKVNRPEAFLHNKVSWNYNPAKGEWTWLDNYNKRKQEVFTFSDETDQWSDGSTTWEYDRTNKRWSQSGSGEVFWTWQPAEQTWLDNQTDQAWRYDETQDRWENTATNAVWHYDVSSATWREKTDPLTNAAVENMPPRALAQHMHIRNTMAAYLLKQALSTHGIAGLSFTKNNDETWTGTVTSNDETATYDYGDATLPITWKNSGTYSDQQATAAWSYNPVEQAWNWHHTHDTLWKQSWIHDGSTWTDSVTNESWSYNDATYTWTRTYPSPSVSWVYETASATWTHSSAVWRYDAATTVWTNTTDNSTWTYDFVSQVWKETSTTNGSSAQNPPLPVVHQETIFHVYAAMQADRVFSSSGAKAWNVTNNNDGTWTAANKDGVASDEELSYDATDEPVVVWKNTRTESFINNKITWTYHPALGKWSWSHTLDPRVETVWTYNESSDVWSNGSVTWSYNRATKVWSNNDHTWSWVPAAQGWKDSATDNLWTYAHETDAWTNTSSAVSWVYDLAANKWFEITSTSASVSDMPPLALVQHMHIRNAMDALLLARTLSTSGLSGLAIQSLGATWKGNVPEDDETISYDPDSSPEVVEWHNKGLYKHQQNSTLWSHNPDTGGWTWKHLYDLLWQKTWTHSGTEWHDEITGDTWSYDMATKTWSYSDSSWQHDVSLDANGLKTWIDHENNATWFYNPADTLWKTKNSSDEFVTWSYDVASEQWKQESVAQPDGSVVMPPLPVRQKVLVDTVFDALRQAGAFSTSGSFGWTLADQGSGVWSGSNTGNNETVTYDPAETFHIHWQNEEGDISWDYNALTGAWKWHSELDLDDQLDGSYQDGSLSWTQDGSSSTWNYTVATRTWQDDAQAHTWAYNPVTTAWKHAQTDTEWTYNPGSGTWTPGSDASLWIYDTAKNAFEKESGSSSVTVFPPKPLIQQTIIRNALASVQRSSALSTSGPFGWSLVKQSDRSWIGLNDGSDEVLSYDPSRETYEIRHTNAGAHDLQKDHLTWKFDLASGNWQWDDIIDNHMPRTWSFHHATGVWTDADGQAVWSYTQSDAPSWTQSETGEVWTYSRTGATWTLSATNHVWEYDRTTGTWHNTSNNTTWRYDMVAHTWKQLTGTTIAPVNMPALPLLQQTVVQDGFVTMVQAFEFSTLHSSYTSENNAFVAMTEKLGQERKDAALALQASTQALEDDIVSWMEEFRTFVNPSYSTTVPVIPTDPISKWHPDRGLQKEDRFSVTFKAKGDSPVAIKLYPFAPTSNQALYEIEINDTTVTIKDQAETLFSQQDATLFAHDDAYHNLWLTYLDGSIRIGSGSPHDETTVEKVSYTIATPSDVVRFIAFAGTGNEYHSIEISEYEAGDDLAESTILNMRTFDEERIGQWKVETETAKTHLQELTTKESDAARTASATSANNRMQTTTTELATVAASNYNQGSGLKHPLSRPAFDVIHAEATQAYALTQAVRTLMLSEEELTARINAIPDTADHDIVVAAYESAETQAALVVVQAQAALDEIKTLTHTSEIATYLAARKESAQLEKDRIHFIGLRVSLTHAQTESLHSSDANVTNSIATQQAAIAVKEEAYIEDIAAQMHAGGDAIEQFYKINSAIFTNALYQSLAAATIALLVEKKAELGLSEFTAYLKERVTILKEQLATSESTATLAQDPLSSIRPVAWDTESLLLQVLELLGFTDSFKVIAPGSNAQTSDVLLSGDSMSAAHLRQLSLSSGNKLDARVRVVINNGARFGLGNAYVGMESNRSLSVLGGDDSVQIAPDGNCVIDLNSDIIISGAHPIVPTENFGNTEGKTHVMEFTSDTDRTITIRTGTELDLTGFGQSEYEDSQELVFSGKVRVVLEHGAKFRFPYLSHDAEKKSLIVRFQDDAQLIVKGTGNRDESRWTDASGSAAARCKMLGVGRLSFEDQSKLTVFDSALLGIESDTQSPKTAIDISLHGSAQFLIGDENKAGGVFQVGNPTDNDKEQIDFSLTIDGRQGAAFYMAREAFVGFAAGTVSKPTSTINGEWKVHTLHNVRNISLALKAGTFYHNQIFDGNNRDASLLAVGPLIHRWAIGKYVLDIAKNRYARFLAGGNVLFVGPHISDTQPHVVTIGSTLTGLGSGDNTGRYSLLAPSLIMQTRKNGATYGAATIVDTESGYKLLGTQKEFYSAVTMDDYVASRDKLVAAGRDQFDTRIGYINGATILRRAIAKSELSNPNFSSNPAENGFLYGIGATDEGDPQLLAV